MYQSPLLLLLFQVFQIIVVTRAASGPFGLQQVLVLNQPYGYPILLNVGSGGVGFRKFQPP